jgi:hypothetical protein
MKHLYRITLIVLLAALIAPGMAEAQVQPKPRKLKKVTVETYGNEPRSTAAAESFKAPEVILNEDAPAADAKGGNTSQIEVINYTGLGIYIYVDRKFVGIAPAYGNLAVNVYDGLTELYAVAVYKDGTQKGFGPRQQKLEGNHYVWVLREKKGVTIPADTTRRDND